MEKTSKLFYVLEVIVETSNRGFSSLAEIDYEDADIECNFPLLEGAALSATSSLNERGPENAHLNGEFSRNFRASCTNVIV